VAKACTVDELLHDPDVEIVLNLTIPNVHAEVSLAAIAAGKHVYSEKPLAVSRADGARVLEAALSRGRRLGGAPDTFLGGGIQTCRKIIDDGLIGRPIGAMAFMTTPGHERWHPAPEFYYKRGGGPMLDMGPYYLTALITLLGPIARFAGSAQTTYPQRIITSEPKRGEKIEVEVPTHVAGILDFASGAVGMMLTSFDVWGTHLPPIEVYGTAGSLLVPDPNTFGGPIHLLRKNETEWCEVPLTFGYAENSRGLGVADMADAIAKDRPHRAAGEVMYHVLDVMEGLHDASASGKYREVPRHRSGDRRHRLGQKGHAHPAGHRMGLPPRRGIMCPSRSERSKPVEGTPRRFGYRPPGRRAEKDRGVHSACRAIALSGRYGDLNMATCFKFLVTDGPIRQFPRGETRSNQSRVRCDRTGLQESRAGGLRSG
jgi:predicted dehydrogenase